MRELLFTWHIAPHRGRTHVAQQLEKLKDEQFAALRQSLVLNVENDRIEGIKDKISTEARRLVEMAENASEQEIRSFIEIDIPIAADLRERNRQTFEVRLDELRKQSDTFQKLSADKAKDVRTALRRFARKVAPDFARKESSEWVDEQSILMIHGYLRAYALYADFARNTEKAYIADDINIDLQMAASTKKASGNHGQLLHR